MPRPSATPSLASENAAPGGTAAVDRALSILFAFESNQRDLTLAELASHTSLHKSTVLRLLASLQHVDLVTRLVDGRYRLGPSISRLNAVYASSFSLEDVILPVLADLVNDTGESAAFHVLQGDVRVCLYRVDSPHPLRDHIRPGDILPLDRGAGGHVLRAYNQPSDPRHKELQDQGVLVQHGDRVEGLSGISAPVLNGEDELVGAITLTMPTERMRKRFVASVKAAARATSKQLGSTKFGKSEA
jgi:DNA-binding IclR family transcriptional regulator